MIQGKELAVTSHVGRDLVASASAFKNEAAVVWEYVVNSLQYVDPGISPRVFVRVSNQEIVIGDNGRGMSSADLTHFFQMHGENLDRKQGRPGRGKFGTGKSAAFGIANSLQIETMRSGKCNVVQLTRERIDGSEGKEIPVEWFVRNEDTTEPNGTVVTISQLNLRNIRRSMISDYIERHLQAFRAVMPQVAVNDHVCEYREPQVSSVHRFTPTEEQAVVLGQVELVIKVAPVPLPEAEQGVAIMAGQGNLIAVERCGIQDKDFGNCLFGEVDVPAVETFESAIEPYDSTRRLQLNPAHPVVRVLLGFVGSKLEKVRTELVKRWKDARKTEQARRLAEEADKIAEILNSDFRDVQRRLQDIRSASARGQAGGKRMAEGSGEGEPESWIQGTTEPGVVQSSGGGKGNGKGRRAPDIKRSAIPDKDGPDSVDPIGNQGTKRRRAAGGFRVEYRNLGKGEHRSVYDSSNLLILINLDHEVVSTALGSGNVQDVTFRRLSYEIAISEYSIALGYILSEQDPDMPPDDLLYEVRDTLNRIASSAAPLYRL